MKSLFAIVFTAVFVLLSLAMPAVGQQPSAAAGLPAGVIVMWSGPLDAIPAGWKLCDGSDGTPDLRNRFVLGAGTGEYQGSAGGSRTHQHRAGNHIHQIDPPSLRRRTVYGYSGYGATGTRGRYYRLPEQTFDLRSFKSDPATVIPDSVSHLPPWYKIAFIIKL